MTTKCLILLGIIGLSSLPADMVFAQEKNLSRLEMDYGTSVKLARFNQILNPQAEKNLEPVVGLNAQAAQKALERYWKGFEKEDKSPVYSINFGTIK
ncbi:MAG: hypothetical protein HY879_23585 [Deltaproteobacteria bacterium]|nr:hypothetical protein [Deltaproteobacteria bacterium]